MAKKIKMPTDGEINQFKMLYDLVDSVYTEMKELSKKKPDDLLNQFKVKNINRILKVLLAFLKNESTAEFLEPLDEESLPSNSDAILVIGQFKASMDNFKKTNTNKYRRWKTVENPDGIDRD